MSKKKPQLAKSETIAELPLACADERAAVEFWEKKRWGDCPGCPRCGSVSVYQMTDRVTGERNARFLWRCRDCRKQYTVRVGTILEDSPIPLRKWCQAFWEASSAKNGISALELSRKLQITHKSALFMLARIRWAMADDHSTPPKLKGIVEADETYVGGKPRHKGWRHGQKKQPREKYTTKTPVFAVVERGGKVRSEVMPSVTSANLKGALRRHVDPRARLMTDESRKYRPVSGEFAAHDRVNHSKSEYARGDVSTNTIESYFARIKRGINGVYHAVSTEHLHRYVTQYEFLYNSRTLNDGERLSALMKRADGKRLLYRHPAVQKAHR